MRQNYFTDFLKKPIWVIFLISWLFYLIGLFLFSQMVWDTNTYMLGFTGADFAEYLSNIRKVDHLRYALSPFWILGISSVIWILIRSGLLIIQVDFNSSLLFKILIFGFVFLSLHLWVKSIGLILIKGNYTPDEVKYFFPGSIVPFLDISNMNMNIINALSHINLYHPLFILFTSWQLSANSELRLFKSLTLVFYT